MGNTDSSPNCITTSSSSCDSLHGPEDNCPENSPFHAAYAKAVSDDQLIYLESFSTEEQDRLLGLTGLTPSQRVKAAILNDNHEKPGRFLTTKEIALAGNDCYIDICDNEIDEYYIPELVFAVVDRATQDASTKGEGLEIGLEQVLFLASAIAKGQGCGVNNIVQAGFEDGIRELEEFGKESDHEWRLSNKAKLSLVELIATFKDVYGPFDHLAATSDLLVGCQGYDQLENM
jgi:hypothetical protein